MLVTILNHRIVAGLALSSLVLVLGACAQAPSRPERPSTPIEETAAVTKRANPVAAAVGASPTMTVHLIDVGQGAATLLEFSCGAVLIDTGGETAGGFGASDRLLQYLNDFFDRRIDLSRTLAAVFLTHPHPDHLLGVSVLMEQENAITIWNVIDNSQKTSTSSAQVRLRNWAKKNARYEGVRVSEVTDQGFTSDVIDPLACAEVDPQIRVLWGSYARRPSGWTNKEFENENNHSLLVRVDFGEASFLFTGDLEEAGERGVVHTYAGGSLLDVDVLQAAHHGAANGTGKDLLVMATPQMILIPVGDPNREITGFTAFGHGHPRAVSVDRFLEFVSRPRATPKVVKVAQGKHAFDSISMERAVFATGWDGNVRVTAKPDGTYRVITQR